MTAPQDRGMTSDVGPIEIDWPRTIGYYGGVSAALAFGLIEMPIAVFIAAVPFFKMLNRPNASWPERAAAQLLEGASKPVGGDAEAAVRLSPAGARESSTGMVGGLFGRAASQMRGIWTDAQALR